MDNGHMNKSKFLDGMMKKAEKKDVWQNETLIEWLCITTMNYENAKTFFFPAKSILLMGMSPARVATKP